MDKKLRRNIMLLIVFAVVVYSAMMNISALVAFVGWIGQMIFPIIIGLIIAFVLNVPMKAYEKLLHHFFPSSMRWPNGLMHVISLVLTLLSIILVISLVVMLVLPGLIDSVTSIYGLIKEKGPDFIDWLNSKNIDGLDTARMKEWVDNLDVNNLLNTIGSSAGSIFLSVFNFAAVALSSIANVVLALIVALYVLLSKDSVTRYAKKMLYAFLKRRWADRICAVAALSNRVFSQYLSGQCIEAFILGALTTISFALLGLPYATVIGVITGVSAFIPFVGAFIACLFGALLILLVNPMQALISIIVALAVQFVETQFIYPHVVGGSVGLSPLLTLLAAMVGGKFMGLFGIIFFIPLTAVIYTLLKGHVNKRLAEKKVKIE
ncbi:MAG: AI-2E family transporter [Ruminococcaceae bacterium]|nr:AI-2E family transporter [Oscillospiraceae bacterium]